MTALNQKEFVLQNESELTTIAEYIIGLLSSTSVTGTTLIALSGDLGAGKTSFTKTFAHILGVTETITSPTFVIQKRYQIHKRELSHNAMIDRIDAVFDKFQYLVHIDAYRLADSDELQKLSFQDTLNNPEQKKIICLEWPEIVPECIPEKHIHIRFEHQEGTTRKVTVESKL